MAQPKKVSDTFEIDDLYVNFLGLLKVERKRTVLKTSREELAAQSSSTGVAIPEGQNSAQPRSRGCLLLFVCVILFLLCYPIIVGAADAYERLYLVPLSIHLGTTVSEGHLLLMIELAISMLIVKLGN